MNKKNLTEPGCEKITPYGGGDSKGEQVERMFDNISPTYDKMNSAMSFGLHRRWRNRAIEEALSRVDASLPLKILDVATGTGDVAFELNRRFPNANIVGIDISDGMLEIARRKLDHAGDQANRHISFRRGDSLDIRSKDNTFDIVSVAYGVRNFSDLRKGLSEMLRVLKPGGHLGIIELSEPHNALAGAGYHFYSRTLIPRLGRIVSGDRKAYSYLLESIANVPQGEDMAGLMREAGFVNVLWKSLTFGVVTIYWGEKAAAENDK